MQAPTESAQGGVSNLPIREDMFNEKNYAGGGIVAFQQGGDTNVFGFKRGTSLMEKYLPSEFSNAQPAIIPTLMGEKARLEKEIQINPNKRYENYERIKQIDTQLLEARAPRTKGGYDPSLEAPAMTDTEVSLKKAIEEAKTNPFADKAVYSGSTVPVEKVKGLADYAKELQDYVGPDKNIALQKERIAKMEARAKRMEDMAPGMAMLEAGLDIASGTSPFALVNVGRGKSGIKSYAESQDKLANLEEKRFGLENDLAKAERAAARSAMREYNAGLRRKPSKNFIGARLPAFVGPRLQQAPRRAYVKKTPEQKFDEAMRKQERAQIRAYKNIVNPKPAPKPRSYAAALRPRAVPYTSKNFIGALSQPQIQKMVLRAEKKQIAALRDLAAAVPLPPDVKARRVKALKQYPPAPSYR